MAFTFSGFTLRVQADPVFSAVGRAWSSSRKLILTLSAVGLLLLSWQSAAAQTEIPAGVQGATISEIVDNPAAYYGQTVTVTGSPSEGLGAQSFMLVDDDFLFFDENIPVILAGQIDLGGQPIETAVQDGQNLLVTGTVRAFNLAELENELGMDLDDAVWSEFDGQPVIIANSIQPAP